MRYILFLCVCVLANGAALAVDLSTFGGATPSMQHTSVAKTTETKSVKAAVSSGQSSETVPLEPTTAEPGDAPQVDADGNEIPSTDAAAAATEPAPAAPVAAASNTMPAVVPPATVDGQPKPVTKYVYKGDRLITVPQLMVRDPRVDDTYVQDMFPTTPRPNVQ